ncbi:MAG TPA: hypothetical protein VFG20_08470, partial [Planctomycetaceae bacterium]|nr:hypothetical protein [Planctomycetaceae bacterium]
SASPRDWRDRVNAWRRGHRRLQTDVDGSAAPSRNTEYLLYQTIIGLWPDAVPTGNDRDTFVARLQEYLLKVEHEAKVNTSWISPHEPYETALCRFVTDIFKTDRSVAFVNDLHEFASKVAIHGRWNSLSQLVLKICSPGVPDFYQGTAVWNRTLVDPDNRHPIDWPANERMFRELLSECSALRPGSTGENLVSKWFDDGVQAEHNAPHPIRDLLQQLLTNAAEGRIKLYVTGLALQARNRFPDLFTSGDYLPLETTGPFRENVVALARQHGAQVMIVVVPRLTVQVAGFGGPPPIGDLWQETAITLAESICEPGSSFGELFSRRKWSPDTNQDISLSVKDALRDFPLGVWIRADNRSSV